MSDKSTNPSNVNSQPEKKTGPRKSLLRKILKVCAWVAGVFVALVVLLMCGIAWILTPERLTPLVEKYGSEYLKADVRAGRIELTVWKSFPYIKLDIEDLSLRSRTLDSLPDSTKRSLPAHASDLLSLSSLEASVNPWHLLRGHVKLGPATIKGLGANLVEVNDSVSNYDIFPPSEPNEEPTDIPIIDFSDINIVGSAPIAYYSVPADLQATLQALNVNINREGEKVDVRIDSPISFASQGHEYLKGVPVSLAGTLDLKQKPIIATTDNLTLSLLGIPVYLKAGISLKDAPSLTELSISLPPVKLLPLLKYVPAEYRENLTELNNLESDIALAVNVNVQTPWRFDSPSLPDVSVTFSIPPCHLVYKAGGHTLDLNRFQLEGSFAYQGAQPSLSMLEIPVLSLQGDGIDLSLTASMREALSENPLIALTSKGHTSLSGFSTLIPLPGTSLKGQVDADASMSCRLRDVMEQRWEKIDADGSLQVRGLLVQVPLLTSKIYSGLINLTFGNAMTAEDRGRGMVHGMLRANLDIDTLYAQVPGITVGARGLNLQAGTTPAMLQEHNEKDVMPMGMKFTAQRLTADSPADTLHLTARALQADGRVTRYQGGKQSPLLQADLEAGRVRYTDPYTRLGVRDFSAGLQAHLRARGNKKRTPTSRPSQASTPDGPVVDMAVEGGLKDLVKHWGVQGAVKASRVNLTYILYPVKTLLTNLALDFSMDSLRLHRAYVQSQGNRMSLQGTVSGLRSTLLGRYRRPLKIRLFTDIDTLDINQVAYNYELGQGLMAKRGMLARINPEDEEALVRAAAEQAPAQNEAVDTVSFILPRNIDAQVHLTAKEAIYTNLALHDTRTTLVLNDGALSVDSLTTKTDFGQGYLNLLYSSRDPQDLNMSVDLGFNHINLVDFYTSFPQIMEMMPAITNLNGMVGASLTGSMNFFPNMDIDMGSINAMLNISGTDLTVSQDPMIRKIARMMLIRKKGDLNISDMNIQVSVHDNVVRLYPFAFSMEKYKFALLGENDLNQNMYYHLSVLNSPIPWKFGINIKGTFEHPKFRFGGPKYKENQAREVLNLVQTERVNFVQQMRLQLHKLVGRAALDYADRHEPDYSKERLDQNMDDTPYEDPAQMMGATIADPIKRALGKNADLLRSLQPDPGKDSKGKKKK